MIAEQEFALSGNGKRYVLSFGKALYYVPKSAIKSFPRKANTIADGATLGSLLSTKAPSQWIRYLHPDCLVKIAGEEGTCIYTTFSVEGHPDEECFLRLVSAPIAEKAFPKWKADLASVELVNDRQRTRMGVLDWTKENDLPSRAQLSPELNRWVSVPTSGPGVIVSCESRPESRKRSSKVGDKRSASDEGCEGVPEGIEWQKSIRVGPEGSFVISQIAGRVLITQFASE